MWRQDNSDPYFLEKQQKNLILFQNENKNFGVLISDSLVFFSTFLIYRMGEIISLLSRV